jgi:UDP-4-amino-4,6-dideoxy-N-acetyl-beta-L-altrosamine transaminase
MRDVSDLPVINYGRQDISDADVAAVVAALQSDFLTQGPAIPRFEQALTDATGAAHAVAVNSATAALHLAYLALGLGPGDLLWTVPNTFVATANAALYCGAEVDFVDIDAATYNLSVPALAAKLEQAEKTGRLPRIVAPVHFAGQSCDMAGIAALARRYGFKLVEDASHAVGGLSGNRPVGACEHADIAVFSFHPVKIVTTGEGGAALTNDPVLAARMRRARSHGITRDPAEMVGASDGPWYYQQIELGLNYRMTDLQAALGASQMDRLPGFIAARHRIAARYDAELAGLPLVLPYQAPFQHSALHLYPVLVGPDARITRAEAYDRLKSLKIGVNVLYIPVYLQPFWQAKGFAPGLCPVAEDYYARSFVLPMFSSLTDDQQTRVIAALHEVLG